MMLRDLDRKSSFYSLSEYWDSFYQETFGSRLSEEDTKSLPVSSYAQKEMKKETLSLSLPVPIPETSDLSSQKMDSKDALSFVSINELPSRIQSLVYKKIKASQQKTPYVGKLLKWSQGHLLAAEQPNLLGETEAIIRQKNKSYSS